jgi:hypothetical protein
MSVAPGPEQTHETTQPENIIAGFCITTLRIYCKSMKS